MQQQIHNTPNNQQDSESYGRHHQNQASRIVTKYYQSIFLVLIVGLSFWFGYTKGSENKQETTESIPFEKSIVKNAENKDVDFSLFWSAWSKLKDKYIDADKLDANTLMYGAIKGMMQATGDPYTTFFDPKENKTFNEEISGNFEGIGAELGVKGGVLTIIAPLDDSPAQKSGLRSGDKIIKVDGKITADMTIDEAVDLIRGKKDTIVSLTIFRNGEEDTREIKVQRGVILVKSVKKENKEGGIVYIKVSRFGDETEQEFYTAINSAVKEKAKGIVLDLRNNPGGYLQSSITMASTLIPKGKTVVIEENADGSKKNLTTLGGDIASSIPLVVLINEGSASASEILAGALKDNRNVQIVGKKSYGKGSVQELLNLSNGTAVKITVARWLTPSGKQINEEGIHPDIDVDLTNDDYQNDRDPQLDKALELIKK